MKSWVLPHLTIIKLCKIIINPKRVIKQMHKKSNQKFLVLENKPGNKNLINQIHREPRKKVKMLDYSKKGEKKWYNMKAVLVEEEGNNNNNNKKSTMRKMRKERMNMTLRIHKKQQTKCNNEGKCKNKWLKIKNSQCKHRWQVKVNLKQHKNSQV